MNNRKTFEQFRQMLMIDEAAEIGGVTTEMLRNGDRSDRLTFSRHPITRYRYCRREEFETFVEKVNAEEHEASI